MYCTEIGKGTMTYTLDSLRNLTKSKIAEIDVLREGEDKEFINGIKLLIMVVDSSEYYAAMYHFMESKVKKLMDNNLKSYYVGKWGKYPAALVRLNNHDAVEAESITKNALSLFCNLEDIILLGVCGTIKYEGYVLVSSEIYRYCEPKPPADEIFDPSNITRPIARSRVFNCLNDNFEQWSFKCTEEGFESKAKFVPMLSGTEYIASGKYQATLICRVNEKGFGVEKDGINVMSAIKKENLNLIIIKGGCNYADECKHEKWQPTAAVAAAGFLYNQLNKDDYEHHFKCKGIVI